MKKTLFSTAFVATLAIAGIYGYNDGKSDNCPLMVELNSVEAIAACESIGWWDNDGNCVRNSNTGEYFCKDDSWPALTDCLRDKNKY